MAEVQADQRVGSPSNNYNDLKVDEATKTIAAVYHKDTAKITKDDLTEAIKLLEFIQRGDSSEVRKVLSQIYEAVEKYSKQLNNNRLRDFSVDKEIDPQLLDKFHDNLFSAIKRVKDLQAKGLQAKGLEEIFENSRRSVNHLLGKEFAGFEVYKILLGNLWGQANRDVYTLLYRIAALPGVVKGKVQRRWEHTKAQGRKVKNATKAKIKSTREATKEKGKGLVGRSKGILARTIGLLSKPLEGIAGLFAKFKAMNAQRRARKNAMLVIAGALNSIAESLDSIKKLQKEMADDLEYHVYIGGPNRHSDQVSAIFGQTKAIEELSATLAELFGDRSTDGRPTEGKLRIGRRREGRRPPGPSRTDKGTVPIITLEDRDPNKEQTQDARLH